MIRSHQDLKVWHAGLDLSVDVYRATQAFPKSETFGLTSQMRRAACSVPANIAEGFSRQHKPEFVQYLHIAKGSLSELDTYMCLCERLAYTDDQTTARIRMAIEEVGKMLHGLISSIRNSMAPGGNKTSD